MRRSSTGTRHSCANHYGYKYAAEDEEQGKIIECREGAIGKQHNAAATPCDDEVADEDVPRLGIASAMTTWIRDRALVPSLETQDDTWRTSEQSGCLRGFSISKISPNVPNSPMIADDEATANILIDCQLRLRRFVYVLTMRRSSRNQQKSRKFCHICRP